MNLALDIASSIEFWRQRYPGDRTPKPPRPVSLSPTACCKRDIVSLKPHWISDEFLSPTSGVLHVLTVDTPLSKRLSRFHVHSWSGPIPEEAFYELQENVYVESPAFMFLHASNLLSFSQLVAFGDELCGLYSFDAREKRGFRKRTKPLLDKKRLESFLQQTRGCRGHGKATAAFPFIIEHSASPMETFDEMTMCLPYRRGGYTLAVPIMNHRVDLTPNATRIAKREKCYLDMGYPLQKLDIEHHGKHDHSSYDDIASDRARVNGLKEMGFEVVELTADQVGDLVAYELIIRRIARLLGKRLWSQKLGPTPERLLLRKELFAWNCSYGRIRNENLT